MSAFNDKSIRENSKRKIYEIEEKLKELKKDPEENSEEIKILEKELRVHYELAHGRD